MVDSSGKVHLVSTFNDAGVQRVTDPAGPSIKNRSSRILNKSFTRQYRPIASVLVTDPVRGFKQTFNSVSEFMDKIGKEANERARVSEWEPAMGEGDAANFEVDTPLSGGGGRGIPGQEGYLMGPKKGEIANTGQGSLESSSKITDAEARGVASHIEREVRDVESPEDVRSSLAGLKDKYESGRLTPAELVAINGYRKIFNELSKQYPDTPQVELVGIMADKIYEKFITKETFVKSIMAEFSPSDIKNAARKRQETGARELTQLRDIAPTTVRGAAPGTGIPSGRGLEAKGVKETPGEAASRDAFIKERSETVGMSRPLSELLLSESNIRASREALASGEKQLSEQARRRGIDVERQRIYRNRGVLPSYEQAAKIYDAGQGPASIRQRNSKAYGDDSGEYKLPRGYSSDSLWDLARQWSTGNKKTQKELKRVGDELLKTNPNLADVQLLNAAKSAFEDRGYSLEEAKMYAYYTLVGGVASKFHPRNIKYFINDLKGSASNGPHSVIDKGVAQVTPPNQATDFKLEPGSIRQTSSKIAKEIPAVLRDFGSMYDSWMVDRISNQGGQVSKEAAEAFRGIIDREKQFYGELTPSLDKARVLAGAGTSVKGVGSVPSISGIRAVDWVNKLKPIKGAPFAARANVVDAIEGRSLPPVFAEKLIEAAQKSNLEIGLMHQMALPGFKASGLFERNVTALGYDIIRDGRGAMWNKWTAALARANNYPIGKTRKFFREWKETLDRPDSDAAAVMSIHQDFSRKFKEVVTHIKGPLGQWEPVVHADLFNYLENSARRASHVRAFRQVWPHTQTGRQDLATVMADLRRELPPEIQKDVDAMMLTMQGHPTDNYSSMGIMGPTRAGGAALRMFNQTIGNAMAKMALTGQMFVQAGEALAGSTPVFLGYKNTIRAMAKLNQLYPELEKQGSVNRIIYDYSLDRHAPIRSAFRAGGNVLSKIFAEHALNEFQESTAAATAFVTAERIKSGNLSAWEKRMLPETFKAMGFTADEVMGLMQADPNLLGQFQRKSAAFLTSGNKAISEGSRLGANRLFNSVFRFQSYQMMKANQFRRVTVGLADAMENGNAREKRNAAEMYSRFLFGTAAQGAITIAITALAYQGIMGAKIKAQEAQDDPVNFLLESFLSTISGPVYMAWRGYKSKGVTGIGENATRAAFPYTVVSELNDFAKGAGRYKDLSQFDKIGEFLKSKTPGTKAISTGLAMAGLSGEDKKLDASVDAFYRWRRDTQGWVKREGSINDDERSEFRKVMKRAVEAMKDGDEEKFNEAYSEAFFLTDKKDSVSQSMKQRKVLQSLTGGQLSPEQMDSLRSRIGDEAVDRLEYFDLMVDEAAKGALLPQYDE